jgi:hypothetical protein
MSRIDIKDKGGGSVSTEPDFRVGDIVECIDTNCIPDKALVIGMCYTIEKVYSGTVKVSIDGVVTSLAYLKTRFKLVRRAAPYEDTNKFFEQTPEVREPKVGDLVKVTGNKSLHNYSTGSGVYLLHKNGDHWATSSTPGGILVEGGWLKECDFEVVVPNEKTPVQWDVRLPRLDDHVDALGTALWFRPTAEAHTFQEDVTGTFKEAEVTSKLIFNQQEESNMSKRRIVTVEVIDNDPGLDVDHSVVAVFKDVVTEDSNEVTINELLHTGCLVNLLEEHNKIRGEQVNKDILNRTGAKVFLEPVKLKNLDLIVKS